LLSNNFVNSAQVGSEHIRASIEKLQNNHKYQRKSASKKIINISVNQRLKK